MRILVAERRAAQASNPLLYAQQLQVAAAHPHAAQAHAAQQHAPQPVQQPAAQPAAWQAQTDLAAALPTRSQLEERVNRV